MGTLLHTVVVPLLILLFVLFLWVCVVTSNSTFTVKLLSSVFSGFLLGYLDTLLSWRSGRFHP